MEYLGGRSVDFIIFDSHPQRITFINATVAYLQEDGAGVGGCAGKRVGFNGNGITPGVRDVLAVGGAVAKSIGKRVEVIGFGGVDPEGVINVLPFVEESGPGLGSGDGHSKKEYGRQGSDVFHFEKLFVNKNFAQNYFFLANPTTSTPSNI